MIRVLDSLQITENYNLYTPGAWVPGDPVVKPAPNTIEEVIAINQQTDPNLICPFWYLCYTNLDTATAVEPDVNAVEPNLNS